jgi:hypothetical protein
LRKKFEHIRISVPSHAEGLILDIRLQTEPSEGDSDVIQIVERKLIR